MAPYCSGGAVYNSALGSCRCPVGEYSQLGGTCATGTPLCSGGSVYRSAANVCACPSSEYFNGTACVVPVAITYPSNAVYPTNVPIIRNATLVSSLPQGTVANVSASIGIQIQTTANSIASSVNGISVKLACISCSAATGNATANGTIEGFVGNGTLSTTANAIAQNAILLRGLVVNYTPHGYTPDLNTSNITERGNSTYVAKWVAAGNSSTVVVNISAIKTAASSPQTLGSVPLVQRVAVPLIKQAFENTTVVNKTTTQQIYVAQTLAGNKTTTRYVPANVTTYGSESAAVVSISNVQNGFATKVNVTGSGIPVRSVNFSVRNNFTASAISIKSYTSANQLGSAGATLPAPPGKAAGYIAVNSTIGDANVRNVNYTFNVTRTWMLNNNVSPENLSLYRYNVSTSSWTKLKTTLVSSNSTSYLYRASSPGMSFYAITGSPFNITAANVAITIRPTNSSTNSTASNAASPYGSLTQTAIVVAVIAMIIIFLILGRPPARSYGQAQDDGHLPETPQGPEPAKQTNY